MKKLLYASIFLVFSTSFMQAQDVAICGWDGSGSTSGSGDEFAFVLLRDFAAGEVIYFTEDEYSNATGNFLFGEGHLAYTIPAGGLLENEVIIILDTGNDIFSVQCAGGSAVKVGSGNWSFSNVDEIYAYSASNPSAPWSSVTNIHCFIFAAVIPPLADQIPSIDYPSVISIIINQGGSSGVNANFMDAFRVNTTMAMLQDGANWTKSPCCSNTNITLTCTDFTTQMILPVELINFDGAENDNKVILNWSTAAELNNAFFQIEHSIDGRNFEIINQVEGVGNSSLVNHYNFIHKDPANGLNYYRLKQIDFDGRFDYSHIVSVIFRRSNDEVLVYPNPFEESISINFSVKENRNVYNSESTIGIFDAYGRLVQSNTFQISDEPIQLNLSKLSGGIYFMRIASGQGEFITHRIVKLHPQR